MGDNYIMSMLHGYFFYRKDVEEIVLCICIFYTFFYCLYMTWHFVVVTCVCVYCICHGVTCIPCGYRSQARDCHCATCKTDTCGCYSLPWRTPRRSWPTTPPPASRLRGGYPGWTQPASGSSGTAFMCHT